MDSRSESPSELPDRRCRSAEATGSQIVIDNTIRPTLAIALGKLRAGIQEKKEKDAATGPSDAATDHPPQLPQSGCSSGHRHHGNDLFAAGNEEELIR